MCQRYLFAPVPVFSFSLAYTFLAILNFMKNLLSAVQGWAQ